MRFFGIGLFHEFMKIFIYSFKKFDFLHIIRRKSNYCSQLSHVFPFFLPNLVLVTHGRIFV
jgi:hypothetical protein